MNAPPLKKVVAMTQGWMQVFALSRRSEDIIEILSSVLCMRCPQCIVVRVLAGTRYGWFVPGGHVRLPGGVRGGEPSRIPYRFFSQRERGEIIDKYNHCVNGNVNSQLWIVFIPGQL